MWATYTARKDWFKAAVKELEPLGMKVVVLKQTILIDTVAAPAAKRKVITSEADFISFARAHSVEAELPRKPMADMARSQASIVGLVSERRDQSMEPWRSQVMTKSGTELATTDDAAEDEIGQLVELGQRAIAQRDGWRRRAIDAEAEVKALTVALDDMRATAAAIDRRFESLRHFLAREFHPDHSNAEGLEKLIKGEFFKRIWPKLEEIERST
jgi:hypothetical protein